jgi:hypothetical protein
MAVAKELFLEQRRPHDQDCGFDDKRFRTRERCSLQ